MLKSKVVWATKATAKHPPSPKSSTTMAKTSLNNKAKGSTAKRGLRSEMDKLARPKRLAQTSASVDYAARALKARRAEVAAKMSKLDAILAAKKAELMALIGARKEELASEQAQLDAALRRLESETAEAKSPTKEVKTEPLELALPILTDSEEEGELKEEQSEAIHQSAHSSTIAAKENNYAFKCAECGRGFPSSNNFQRHLRVHTGERPFPCPNCSYAAKTQENLGRHLRRHTGERPYPCSSCSYAARLKEHLTRHVESKHWGL